MKVLRILFLLLLLFSIAAFITLAARQDPETWLFETIGLIDDHPAFLILIISLLTMVFTLTGLPVFYLAMALGYVFGFGGGSILAWLINLLSVALTFAAVRYLFSDYFRKLAERKKFLDRLNGGLEKYGTWYVAFSRAIYLIPTNIINYGFALTRIRGRNFLAGTAIGLVTESVINAGAGALLKKEVPLLHSDLSLLRLLIIAGSVLLLLVLFLLFKNRQDKKNRPGA